MSCRPEGRRYPHPGDLPGGGGAGIPVCTCRYGACLTPNDTVSARRKSRVRKFTARFRPGLRAGRRTLFIRIWTSMAATASGTTLTGTMRSRDSHTCGCGWRSRIPERRTAGTLCLPTVTKWPSRTAAATSTCRIFPTLYMTLNIRTPLPVTTTPATGHSPGKQHAVDEGLLGRGPVKLATNSLYLVSVGCAHRHFSS